MADGCDIVEERNGAVGRLEVRNVFLVYPDGVPTLLLFCIDECEHQCVCGCGIADRQFHLVPVGEPVDEYRVASSGRDGQCVKDADGSFRAVGYCVKTVGAVYDVIDGTLRGVACGRQDGRYDDGEYSFNVF